MRSIFGLLLTLPALVLTSTRINYNENQLSFSSTYAPLNQLRGLGLLLLLLQVGVLKQESTCLQELRLYQYQLPNDGHFRHVVVHRLGHVPYLVPLASTAASTSAKATSFLASSIGWEKRYSIKLWTTLLEEETRCTTGGKNTNKDDTTTRALEEDGFHFLLLSELL